MENTFVNENTLVGELVDQYPETMDLLMGIGMHCLGCPASQAESVKDACAVHGIDAQLMVEALNVKIAESRE
jgi:hybrid cluster-associated redox disulfide protein